MPKSKETATTAVYENNGQEFDSKRAADNYGVFNVPKVERKAKA
jgi:hypothetical protein